MRKLRSKSETVADKLSDFEGGEVEHVNVDTRPNANPESVAHDQVCNVQVL